PEPVGPLPAHLVTFPAQEDPDAPVAVARVLLGQAFHRLQHGSVLSWHLAFVGQHRSSYPDQLAGPALRVAARHREAHLLDPALRAHHFFRLISLSVSMAISRSATMRLSFAFSASSSRSRFTSAGSNSPKRLRQPYSVCSLILCLRATSATGMRSASRRIATICSSVNLLFLMGSSPRGESHSLNLSVRRKFRAGQDIDGRVGHVGRPRQAAPAVGRSYAIMPPRDSVSLTPTRSSPAASRTRRTPPG